MSTAPQIDVWYGPLQRAGHCGQSQRWVNVLGRVRSASSLRSLECSLNGQAFQPLSVGPDQRRLLAPGDFNIDLEVGRLVQGANQIQIAAVDINGNHASSVVAVDYASADCPLPFMIDWNQVSHIQDVAHIADGLWSITGGVISPIEVGYDRLLTLGDMRWRDYEVTVPITVHGINGGCYAHPSVHAGVGVVMRWKGHSEWEPDTYASGQPAFCPSPYGAIGWYCVFHDEGPLLNFFDPDFKRSAEKPLKLKLHTPHVLRARVQTNPSGSSNYALKVWEQSRTEPDSWDLQVAGHPASLGHGAVGLVAHHIAASFGNVSVSAV